MTRKILCSLQMIGYAVVLAVPVAKAQEAPPVRIRGTIERVDSSIYVVKARDGAELKVTLADKPQIAGIVKASLSDIKQNSFVGVTAMPQPDGSLKAVEVHIFPEAMRGSGEGHYPWDLRPQSTMTNANAEQIAAAVDGPTLTLWRESFGHCGQAPGWNAGRSRLARRPRWTDTANVTFGANKIWQPEPLAPDCEYSQLRAD